jgi:hypothetical protein
MKRFLLAAALVALSAPLAAPATAADVGVSISIGQPGFYGHIDIGNYPRPQLIYPDPIIVQSLPAGIVHQPMYLHVPPGHAKNWRKHCSKYRACGQPVYFVDERWYSDVYVPHYRERHPQGQGAHRVRDHRHDGPRNHTHEQRDRDHGNGNGDRGDGGRGNGRDKG